MHRCCAVNAIDGGGVIAGLNVFAVGVDGVFGVVELDYVLPRDRAFCRVIPVVPIASTTRSGLGDSAVPF
jgi:hypothetical protein